MRKSLLIIPICSSIIFASGCLPSNVKDEIEKVEEENVQKEEQNPSKDEDIAPEDVKVSDEQKEALNDRDHVSKESAIHELIEEQKEIDIKLPEEKSKFTSEHDLSQYMANLFFLFHKGDLSGEKFYELAKPHLHENFLAMLPETEADRIETFEILQYTFLQYLPAPIESYEITEATRNIRGDEGESIRKYITDDYQFIYYKLTMNEVDGQWLITDDGPAPPYEINPIKEESFKSPGGE